MNRNIIGLEQREDGSLWANIKILQINPDFKMDDESLEELVEYTKTHGILEPILISEDYKGSFKVISGFRRIVAAKKARIDIIPVRILK